MSDKIDIDASNLKKGEKIVYDYDMNGRVRSVRRVDAKDCWVVTAYYGHPLHPDVCRIRGMRENLYKRPLLGPTVRALNWAYLRTGRMKVGIFWSKCLLNERSKFARPLTARICRTLLSLASNVNSENT